MTKKWMTTFALLAPLMISSPFSVRADDAAKADKKQECACGKDEKNCKCSEKSASGKKKCSCKHDKKES